MSAPVNPRDIAASPAQVMGAPSPDIRFLTTSFTRSMPEPENRATTVQQFFTTAGSVAVNRDSTRAFSGWDGDTRLFPDVEPCPACGSRLMGGVCQMCAPEPPSMEGTDNPFRKRKRRLELAPKK